MPVPSTPTTSVATSSIAGRIANMNTAGQPTNGKPLWGGPTGTGPNGGVTQSMLSRFLVCKERFRLQVVEGLRESDRWNHRTGYGNMWHCCEEAFATGHCEVCNGSGMPNGVSGYACPGCDWQASLKQYAQEQCRQYPLQQQEIDKWYNVCLKQFPDYIQYWSKHPDVVNRTPLVQEQVFDVPYQLPSGRTLRLRGKWDGVDLLPAHTDANGFQWPAGLWLMEHKTKGDIDEQQIRRQLSFDLQTMTYLVALAEYKNNEGKMYEVLRDAGVLSDPSCDPVPILGVRYNVCRRPLSGGKGTIVQGKGTAGAKCSRCKGTGEFTSKNGKPDLSCNKCNGRGRIGGKPAETKEEFFGRLAQYIKDEPETYFMRWTCGITPQDVKRFQRECLDPVLENLCDDWEWWQRCCMTRLGEVIGGGVFGGKTRRNLFPHHCPRHFRMPFGVRSGLMEGGETEMDEFLKNGSEVGLRRVTDLFPELEEVS